MNRIPEKHFQIIKKNIPLSCVDIILVKKNKFLLVKRKIPPYKGYWCLPGGIIKFGQTISNKIKQIGNEELGIKLKIVKRFGFYEKIYKERHDISHCFIVCSHSDKLVLNSQASEAKFFSTIPKGTAPFHAKMLKDAGF